MKFPIYKDKNQEESLRKAKLRIAELETQPLADNKAEIVAHVHNMMEATSAVGPKSYGGFKKGTLATIDEDTNAAVVAHTQFEDPFGNGIPISSPFVSGRISLPLSDDEGRTAWYHGYYNPVVNRLNMSWVYNPPVVAHTSLHMMSRAFELNIPGSSAFDKDAFVYYASNAVFNISGNVSHAIWFYPVAIAEAAEVFSFLQWRYIDASNWYAVVIRNTTNRIQVHVREGGTTTKLQCSTAMNLNAWNLIVWTYVPGTNALAPELNNSTTTTTPTETLTVPYTTDSNMYLGNIPNSNAKRFEGYLGQYVSWSIALSTTQRDNFFSHGTIV